MEKKFLFRTRSFLHGYVVTHLKEFSKNIVQQFDLFNVTPSRLKTANYNLYCTVSPSLSLRLSFEPIFCVSEDEFIGS